MRDGKARVPTSDEINRLLAVIASRRYAERNKSMVLLSYGCGLRVGEIAAINTEDVLNDDGTIKQEFVLKRSTTKTKRSRTVFLTNKQVVAALKEYIAHLLTMGNVQLGDDIPLFKSQWNMRFNGHNLGAVFAVLYKAAGLTGCKSHSGRRTYATTLLTRRKVDIKSVSLLMGHSNIKQTAEYAEGSPDILKSANAQAMATDDDPSTNRGESGGAP